MERTTLTEEVKFEKTLLKNGKKARSVFDRIYEKYDRTFEECEAGGAIIDLVKVGLGEDDFLRECSVIDRPRYEPSDDDTDPDPELAALLHEKVVEVKREINWNETELLHQEKLRQRAALEGSDSDYSDDEESPRVRLHARKRGKFSSSSLRQTKRQPWCPTKQSPTTYCRSAATSMSESVDNSDQSLLGDELSVTSAPECPLDYTRHPQLSMSMYELGEGDPANQSAYGILISPNSKSMYELEEWGPGNQDGDETIKSLDSVSIYKFEGGPPVNQDTDDTLTSPNSDDPYHDLQSGYETNTPVNREHSTPKLRKRPRSPLRTSPVNSSTLKMKIGGTPVNQETDDTPTSPNSDDPYRDLQSGYETNTPINRKHSTPKLRKGPRSPLRTSPVNSSTVKVPICTVAGYISATCTSDTQHGYFPSAPAYISPPLQKTPGPVPSCVSAATSDTQHGCFPSAPASPLQKKPGPVPSCVSAATLWTKSRPISTTAGSVFSQKVSVPSTAVEFDADCRVVQQKRIELKILKLPYGKKVLSDSLICAQESVQSFDPLVHDANPSISQNSSLHNQPQTTQADFYQPHNIHPVSCHQQHPVCYCNHNQTSLNHPPTKLSHDQPYCHLNHFAQVNPTEHLVTTTFNHCTQCHSTAPAINCQQCSFPAPPPLSFQRQPSVSCCSCEGGNSFLVADCHHAGCLPGNGVKGAASKRQLETSNSSEYLPSKKSKQ